MAFWIQDIQHELGITVLMVEHDMSLVSKVSDRVLAMNQGEVLAIGTPREVQARSGRDRGLSGHGGRRDRCARRPGSAAWRRACRRRAQPTHDRRALDRTASDATCTSPCCAAERRERLRPDQGDPRRQPAGAARRDRHRARLQRRRQDHHPQDHLRHHRSAQGQHRVQGPGHHRQATRRYIVQQGLSPRARGPRGVPAAVGAATTC